MLKNKLKTLFLSIVMGLAIFSSAHAQMTNQAVQTETPWAWYVSRASGLVSFALLYISIFLVLTIRIPYLRKIFAPAIALNVHCWIALQALIFGLLHGVILIFDKFIGISLFNVFVPFSSSYQPWLVGFGTIGFYLMLILVASSYVRAKIGYPIWRALHYFNIALYFILIIHIYFLGTDMKNETVRSIFVWSNAVLILLMFQSMFFRIRQNIQSESNIAQ